MSINQYRFLTVWKFEASLQDVWQTISNVEDFPTWWKAVVDLKVIDPGEADGLNLISQQVWKGRLPYSLSFIARITAVYPQKTIEIQASGNLKGRGKWTFSEADGIVTVQYLWEVETTQKYLSFLAFLLKPLLVWNHNEIMKWGALGLAKKLQVRLIES